MIVGVVSFGLNSNCKGADFAFRADIPITQDFRARFGVGRWEPDPQPGRRP